MTRLLVLPGDGIGPEVTEAGLAVLDRLAPDVDTVQADVGRSARQAHGDPLSPRARELVDDVDGIVFGAAATEPGQASAILELRRLAGARVSVRPARGPQAGPDQAATVVYRELAEGLYAGEGHLEDDRAEVTRTITRDGARAFAEIALDHAPDGAPVTIAHKANVLDRTDGLFLDTVRGRARARGHPVDAAIVDALAHDMARDPDTARTVLAPNLYGDVLSDLAAGLNGGLGLAGSLTLGEGPPVAEPVHGTAPDVAGTGQANPTAMLRSIALLLDELGHGREADRLEAGLAETLAHGPRTPDLGGQATTQAVTDAVLDTLELAV